MEEGEGVGTLLLDDGMSGTVSFTISRGREGRDDYGEMHGERDLIREAMLCPASTLVIAGGAQVRVQFTKFLGLGSAMFSVAGPRPPAL